MNASPHIVSPSQMRELCGLRRGKPATAATVRKWAKSQGIPYKDGADGPWTTDVAINKALGVGSANDPQYQPDDIA